jgi:hypothetical protein
MLGLSAGGLVMMLPNISIDEDIIQTDVAYSLTPALPFDS